MDATLVSQLATAQMSHASSPSCLGIPRPLAPDHPSRRRMISRASHVERTTLLLAALRGATDENTNQNREIANMAQRLQSETESRCRAQIIADRTGPRRWFDGCGGALVPQGALGRPDRGVKTVPGLADL